LGRFEQSMETAGLTVGKSVDAVSRFNTAMTKFEQAQQRGVAATTQSYDPLSRQQRALEKLAGSLDSTYSLQIKLQRQASRDAVDAANLVTAGLVSQEDALRALASQQENYNAQLAEMRAQSSSLSQTQSVVAK